MRRDTGWHATRIGLAKGQQTGTGFHQQAVRMAVVTTLEFNDLVATGKTTCSSYRAHGRLGATAI